MAEWLLEIFSEEIPARMQQGAEAQLKTLAEKHLATEGLSYQSLKTFITPRRLTLVVEGLPLETSEKVIEKKGPLVTAPQAAIEGFLKTNGLSQKECVVRQTPKGDCLFAFQKTRTQPTRDILPSIALSCLKDFHWPKTMRWGTEPIPWVRPIRSFISLFNNEVVPFSYAGVTASNTTQGHRFLSHGSFTVANFKDYETKLKDHFVILDWHTRHTLIEKEILRIAHEAGFTPLEDPALLNEVTGLVEWPVALKGQIDPDFMVLPREVITTPMRHHQRYFPFRDAQGNLAPYFGLITHCQASDHGKTIVTGNERVLRARLADAKFFWEQDQKKPLERFNEALKTRLFHQHLGSLFDKVERLKTLSTHLAEKSGIDPRNVARAALLSKADLASLMVGEFPELQGIMGKYYALHQEEPQDVAQALEEQYWPKGAEGIPPCSRTSLLLGLADRLDTLVGFFTIGITPTGSKDPYALRRAALGLITLSLTSHVNFSMLDALSAAYTAYAWKDVSAPLIKSKEDAVQTVWLFLLERFKFYLKDEKGCPYDHVEAVLSVAHDNPTFYELASRVQALGHLMGKEDGQNLLAAYKRASHLLTIEEEKEKRPFSGTPVEERLIATEEKDLYTQLQVKTFAIHSLVQQGDFITAVQTLAALRPYVDTFFNTVVVNCEEPEIRENRLQLLAALRKTLHQVADFSKIES